MFKTMFSWIESHVTLLYIILIIFIGFLTFFTQYQTPSNPIWDEVYHISSGEKYLQNTHFMEAHPPLGKLLIAAGEYIIAPNSSYENLNPAARACLFLTPATYSYTNDAGKTVEEKKVDGLFGKRDMNLLDVRERTRDAIDKDSFTETDSIKEFPDHFSYCGFRFFPVIFASFIPLLIFLIIYYGVKNNHLALFGASLVAFDNALVVHLRAAMLDGIQLVFILLAMVFFVRAVSARVREQKPISLLSYIIVSVMVGLSIATKHNGLIFMSVPAALVLFDIGFTLTSHQSNESSLWHRVLAVIPQTQMILIKYISKAVMAACIGVLVYCAIFFVHIGLGQTIVSTNSNNNGEYKASNTYLQLISNKEFSNIDLYFTGLDDNVVYMDEYHEGVPKLNLQSETENGSYPTNWPVMNKTISYRWDTPDGTNYSYVYLVGNPFVWGIGLISFIFAANLIFSSLIHKIEIKQKLTYFYIVCISSLYVVYMAAMLYVISIRVMYLYHYFIPLILSLLLAPLLIHFYTGSELEKTPIDISTKNKPFIVYTSLIVMIGIVLFGFIWYSPFTYHLPLTHEEFKMRRWFDFWQMKHANEGK